MHLNDEQLEEARSGSQGHAGHLAVCADCRQRLAEQRETSSRLHDAFAAVRAGDDLAARVRQGLAKPKARPLIIRWMPALAAAAALIIAVPLIVISLSSSDAQAAQSQLAQIHQTNLDEIGNPTRFYSEDDPAKLAAYFKEKLHFSPAMPKPDQGLAMRGCCVAHFGKDVAGSYVVKTPSGLISIIIVQRSPRELDLKDAVNVNGKAYFRGAYAKCNMVVTRLGNYTYCAVANNDVSPDKLIDLLGRLVN
jgi:hypothetical protein